MSSCSFYEELRLKYKPEKIRVLLIGVSPPKKTFFYKKNSILYHAVFKAFSKVFNVNEINFLMFFRDLGFYLVDMFPHRCGSKIDELEDEVKENIKLKISTTEHLRHILVSEKPKAIIICFNFKRRKYTNLREIINKALEQSRLNIQIIKYISFPRGKHFKKTVQELKEILKELIQKRIIPRENP